MADDLSCSKLTLALFLIMKPSQNLSIFSADFSRLQLGLLSATICTHAHGAPVLLAAATAELYRESLAIILGDV